MAARRRQFVSVLSLVVLIGIAGGCLTESKSGLSLQGGGSVVNYDRHAKKLEVRPTEVTLPIGKQLVLLATVYDDENKPRSKRRLEWKIDGQGVILELDGGSFWQGRGFKEDSKSAVTFTEISEKTLPPGVDNPLGQVIRPGQTWCAITSAAEGQTIVHAYAPEIADANFNRVMVKVNWVDARWQFPTASSAQAGSALQLQTRVTRISNQQPLANFSVRYSLLDNGPQASIFPASAKRDGAPRQAIVPLDAQGMASASIVELKPEFGTSQIGIEVLRADPTQAGGYVVLAKSQTKVEWQAPDVKVSVNAPKAIGIGETFPVAYAVASRGTLPTQPMMVKAAVPPGVELVSSDPKATVDGNELLWQVASLPAGKQATLQATFRSKQAGNLNVAASVRTNDDLRADASAIVQVTQAQLQLTMTGPQAGLVGENLPYRIVVNNSGSGAATNVKVQTQFDAGLEVVDKPGPYETTIDRIEPGQTQTIALPLTPKQAGKSAVKALLTADGGLSAETPAIGVDIKKPELTVQAFGPANGYLNQEITWTVRVFNPSEVPVSNVVVQAVLPPGLTFSKASNDGKYAKGTVEWTVGTSIGKQWTDLQVTAVATALGKALLTANVMGAPLSSRDGAFKPVAMVKPFGADCTAPVVEILGIPALHIDVSDSADPVLVGQNLTYTIRIKNGGTLTANQVDVTADLPVQIKALRAAGPADGVIEGGHVTFPTIASIPPNQTVSFTIEAQAVSEGDGRFTAQVKSLSLNSPLRSDETTRVISKNDSVRR